MTSCLLSLVMDRFVRRKEKKERKSTIPFDNACMLTFRSLISSNHSIYIHGPVGCGKTEYVKTCLAASPHMYINIDELRSKGTVVKILDRYRDSNKVIVLDGVDEVTSPLTFGMRHLSDNMWKIGNSSLVVVGSSSSKMMDEKNIVQLPVPPPSKEAINSIGTKEHWESCNGDIRKYKQLSRGHSDKKDIFVQPKSIAEGILTNNLKLSLESLLSDVSQHGSVWGIIHQNAWKTKGIDMLELTETMSLSDYIDTKIYDGNWSLYPYFLASAVALPKVLIGDESTSALLLEPASAWSKHNNIAMRRNKLRKILSRSRRGTSQITDLEALSHVMLCSSIEEMYSYRILPSDIDFLNSISVRRSKKKQSDSIKRQLKKHTQEREREDVCTN